MSSPRHSILIPALKRSLALLLTLSLSGTLPVVRVALAQGKPSEPTSAEAVLEEARALEQRLALEVRRARYVNSPGTPAGRPTQDDVTRLEEEFARWKAQVERLLAFPSEPEHEDSAFVAPEQKLQVIDTYLNELTQLATLRIALAMSHGPAWINRQCLQVPASVTGLLSGLGRLSTDRVGNRFAPMVIDREPKDGGGTACLKLSANLVQGLEIARLGDVQGDDSHLTMVKYLATRQLLSNLMDLRYLKKDRQAEIPEIPERLRAKLESMGMAAAIAEEQHRSVAEPAIRLAVLDRYATVADKAPPFANDALASALVRIVGPASMPAEGRESLRDILAQAERDGTRTALSKELEPASVSLSGLGEQELGRELAELLANARGSAVLDKLLELIGGGAFGDVGFEKGKKISEALEAHRLAYRSSVTSLAASGNPLIADWVKASNAASDETLFDRQRADFVQSLMAQAPLVTGNYQMTYAGDLIDLHALSAVFGQEIRQLGLTDQGHGWISEILSSGSFLSARARYNEIMASQTHEDVLYGGIIDPAKVESFVARHDYTPAIRFSQNTAPALAQSIRERIASARKNDVLGLLKYAGLMGFHGVYMGVEPDLHQVLRDEDKIASYLERLEASVGNNYPILGTEIQYVASDGWKHQGTLAEVLAGLNPEVVSSPETLQEATAAIDQALAEVEAKIRRNIRVIAEAESVEELEAIVGSSMMLGLALRGFPEFKLHQEEVLRRILSPSIADQLAQRYLPPVMYGIGALMVIKFVNWGAKKASSRAFPVTNVLALGLESTLAGYERYLMALFTADLAYQATEFAHSYRNQRQSEDFALCSAEGRCLVSASELKNARSGFKYNAWAMGGRIVGDLALMYVPMAHGLITRLGDRVLTAELALDQAAFGKLGLRAGEFGRVGNARKIAEELRAGRSPLTPHAQDAALHKELASRKLATLSAAEWGEYQRAIDRLTAKIQAGRTYRLPTVVERMATEDALRTLDLSPAKIMRASSASLPTAKELETLRGAAVQRINAAADLHLKAAALPEQATKVKAAANFLRVKAATDPSFLIQPYPPLSRAERRLLGAFNRGPALPSYWEEFAKQEREGLPFVAASTAPSELAR